MDGKAHPDAKRKEVVKMTWLRYFRLWMELIWLEISALPHSDFLRRVRAQAADFWRRTQRLAIIVIIIPIIIFVAGIIFHSRPTIAIAGLLATICWGTILFAFASIAELIAAVYREVRGLGGEALGRIYLKAVATILLGEMMVVGYTIIVPVWNNPGAIPIVAMMAILLATMIAVWKMQYNVFHQIAFWIAVAAFVFFTASFFLPNSFSAIQREAPKIDQYFSSIVDNDDVANKYKDQRKALIKKWFESEQAAIFSMLTQDLITSEESDRRMENLTAQRDQELKRINAIGSSDNSDPAPLGDKLKKSIPNLPVVLKIIFITAAAFLILGLIWTKYLKNGWLKTAALLAVGGTAIYFIIAILQSSGVAI